MRRLALLAVGLLVACATATPRSKVGESLESILVPVVGRSSLPPVAGKVVIVEVWASWSQACSHALPADAQLVDELGAQGLIVVSINVDADPRWADAFLDTLGVRNKFIVLRDPEARQVERHLDIARLPTTYYVDRSGLVRSVESGFDPAARGRMRELVVRMLNEPHS